MLLTNLVIIFVLWVSSGVLYEPRQCHCFGTIFPNLNFVFAPISAARPVNIQSDQYRSSTVKQRRAVRHPDGEQPKPALWLWVREMTCYLYTKGVRGRIKAKQRWFKVTRELSWMVSSCSASCSWRPLDWRIRHSHLTSTLFHLSQSRSVVTSAENPAPENSPQSIGERGQFTRTIMPDWFEKLRDMKFWYMC